MSSIKKLKKYNRLANLVVAFLVFVALIMMFLPAVVVFEDNYSGLNVVFGHSEEFLGSTIKYFDFSFLNFLNYLFVIAIIALSVLGYKKENMLFVFVATCLSLVSALFFFLTKSLCVSEFFGSVVSSSDSQLGIGSIIGGIFMILATVVNGFKIALPYLK